MIVVGGGAQDDAEAVLHLASRIGAPVVAFRTGHGVVPSDDPLSISMPVAHDLWTDVDLVIGLGTRLQSQVMAWGQDDAMKIVHIDIDETQIGRSARVDVGIHATLGDALPLLLDDVEALADPNSDWLDRIARRRHAVPRSMNSVLHRSWDGLTPSAPRYHRRGFLSMN